MSIELRRARNRQMLIFLLVCAGMVALIGRLYFWQVVRGYGTANCAHGFGLAQCANLEHIQNQQLNAPRGLIYDVQGHILATNVVRDDVYIEPYQFSADHSADTFQSELAKLVDTLRRVLPAVSQETLYKDFNLGYQTVRIASRIDPTQSEQLRRLQLPYVFLEPRTWRIYPGGTLAAQVLGYVQQDDQKSNGIYGIERQYNTLLTGKPGSFTAEFDLSGNPLVVGASSEQPAVNGADLTLTIDSNMQYMAQTALADTVKQLGAESGTALVINIRTGAIVVMAGAPTFDPNQYGKSATLTGCLGQESVFFNPVVYCAYEPGSIMKAVTMAAALDQGLITPDTTFDDPGYRTFNDAPMVVNWNGLAYGTESMTQVLEHSANVGAAYVAHDILGANRYYPYLAKFGFGQATGISPQEETGSYRTPSNSPRLWSPSDLTRQAFGQSIFATPLQVAMAYATIANGGVMMHPYLVSTINNNGRIVTTQPEALRRVISAHAATLLTNMLMHSATNGLAQPAQVPGYTIAAKTGTATTQGLTSDKTEASVAGFIPATNPLFVILVKIDRPQATIYGGTAAAPLWKAIGQQLMWYYHIPPDAP